MYTQKQIEAGCINEHHLLGLDVNYCLDFFTAWATVEFDQPITHHKNGFTVHGVTLSKLTLKISFDFDTEGLTSFEKKTLMQADEKWNDSELIIDDFDTWEVIDRQDDKGQIHDLDVDFKERIITIY